MFLFATLCRYLEVALPGARALIACFTLVVAAASCGPPSLRDASPRATTTAQAVAMAEPGEGATWAPQPSEREHSLARLCARRDGALDRVAERTAAALRDGGPAPEPSEVALELRFQGAPYVWPRVWVLSGPALAGEQSSRMQQWLGSFGGIGERRCGLAVLSVTPRSELLVAIAVDAIADLAPLPRTARVNSWIEIDARLLVPSGGAKVVVLGPRGAPKSVPTSVQDSRVRARFNADSPGEWLVQVLASVQGGPRPVLEAMVHVGVDPERDARAVAVPGEQAARAGDDPITALDRMIAALRESLALRALRRDAELDAVAQAHADAMRAERRVAHELGAGDPASRVEQLGRAVIRVGENVAHAATIVRAHRALFRSPSHRANLQDPVYDSVGIGVATDEDGAVWVCEVFARFAP